MVEDLNEDEDDEEMEVESEADEQEKPKKAKGKKKAASSARRKSAPAAVSNIPTKAMLKGTPAVESNCPYCGFVCPTKKDFFEHRDDQHKFMCSECDREMKTVSHMRQHLKNVHNVDKQNSEIKRRGEDGINADKENETADEDEIDDDEEDPDGEAKRDEGSDDEASEEEEEDAVFKLPAPVPGCNLCSDGTFPNEDDYQRHVAEESPHKCTSCMYYHALPAEVERHRQNVHRESSGGEGTPNTRRRGSISALVVQNLSCEECKVTFPDVEAKLNHVHVQNSKQEKDVVVCSICSHTTKTKQGWKYHMRTKHPEATNGIPKEGQQQEEQEVGEEDEEDGSQAAVIVPEVEQSDREVEVCFPEASSLVPAATPGRITCTDCDKTFAHARTLTGHKITIHQNYYQCPGCQFTSTAKKVLRDHVKVKHGDAAAKDLNYELTRPANPKEEPQSETATNNQSPAASERRTELVKVTSVVGEDAIRNLNPVMEEDYQEEDVDEEKGTAPGVLTHEESMEVARRASYPRECGECGQSLESEGELLAHVNQEHSKRWCCNHCRNTFASKSNARVHMRKIHKVEGVARRLSERIVAELKDALEDAAVTAEMDEEPEPVEQQQPQTEQVKGDSDLATVTSELDHSGIQEIRDEEDTSNEGSTLNTSLPTFTFNDTALNKEEATVSKAGEEGDKQLAVHHETDRKEEDVVTIEKEKALTEDNPSADDSLSLADTQQVAVNTLAVEDNGNLSDDTSSMETQPGYGEPLQKTIAPPMPTIAPVTSLANANLLTCFTIPNSAPVLASIFNQESPLPAAPVLDSILNLEAPVPKATPSSTIESSGNPDLEETRLSDMNGGNLDLTRNSGLSSTILAETSTEDADESLSFSMQRNKGNPVGNETANLTADDFSILTANATTDFGGDEQDTEEEMSLNQKTEADPVSRKRPAPVDDDDDDETPHPLKRCRTAPPACTASGRDPESKLASRYQCQHCGIKMNLEKTHKSHLTSCGGGRGIMESNTVVEEKKESEEQDVA